MTGAADPFTIWVDPDRRLIRIVMRGLWTVETVARYREALDREVDTVVAKGIPHGALAALVDARALSAQTQDAINSFRERFSDDVHVPRRLATLVSSALFRRQAERIGVPNQRLFTDEAEALAWLLDPGAPG